jgi:hypothetical protein
LRVAPLFGLEVMLLGKSSGYSRYFASENMYVSGNNLGYCGL